MMQFRASLNSSFEDPFKNEDIKAFEYKPPVNDVLQLPIDLAINEYTNNTSNRNGYSVKESINR